MGRSRSISVTINDRVWTRTENGRPFTHAIAALPDRDRAWKLAVGWTVDEQREAEELFRGHAAIADGTFWTRQGLIVPTTTDKNERFRARLESSRAVAKSGLDAFIRTFRDQKIERVNADVAQGLFKWHVIAWATSEELADAEVAFRRRMPFYKNVMAIEVGDRVQLLGEK